MFPLSAVVFPGSAFTLRVFEPRYLELVKDCVDNSQLFGVCLIEKGHEVGGGDERYEFGTLAEILQVVQIGNESGPLLQNVIDYRGKTSFREAAILIGESELFLSTEGGLVHAATTVDTRSLVIITGYQDVRMVAYPQNININIGNHEPCGLKVKCDECSAEANSHNEQEIVDKVLDTLL